MKHFQDKRSYARVQISTVGHIPKGFPPASTTHFQTNGHFSQLFLTSLMVTGVGILETIGIAKALASKNGYEINTNQVLYLEFWLSVSFILVHSNLAHGLQTF